MTPDLPPNPRAELEAKVTAWLLGELSAEEAASMREQIAKDPELGRLQERLSQTLNLLRETVATPMGETPAQPTPLKLSSARREKLLAHFKTIRPQEFVQQPRRKTSWVFVIAAAASVAILAALLIPSVSSRAKFQARIQAQKSIVMNNLATLNQPTPAPVMTPPAVEHEITALPSEPPSVAPVANADTLQNLHARRLSETTTNAIILPQRREQQLAQENNQQNAGVAQLKDIDPLNNNSSLGVQTEQLAGKKLAETPAATSAAGKMAGINSYYNEGSAKTRTLNGWQGTAPGSPLPTQGVAIGGGANLVVVNGAGNLSYGPDSGSTSASSFESGKVELAKAEPSERAAELPPDNSIRQAYADLPSGVSDAPKMSLAPAHAAEGKLRMRIQPAPITTPLPQSAPAPAAVVTLDGSSTATTISTNAVITYALQESLKEKLSADKSKDELAAAETDRGELYKRLPADNKKLDQSDAPLARPILPAPVPQPEVLTRDNAFTTFSLNISDVAFKLAQASLQNGVMPEAASMRSEEFINAFDYRDPEPAPGAPIGFAWEQAGDPFAHNRNFLRFAIKTAAQGRQAGRPLNLVLLLDKSGSMERADRVAIIANALRVLASQLQPQDTLSVVVFARTARLFVDGVPGSEAGDVAKKLRGLTPEGGTNLEEAMRLAYETALRHYLANGENRVVLLTDGAANLGNIQPAALKQNVETNRKQGIALDCFGVGWDGYNDDLLATLSRAGNGRYGFINTPEEAATEFAGKLAGALRVAAADVKVQVEFNSKRVTSYRQIGYAKDQLKKQDFRDNNVKAAQIGAAESGNALYTVEINPAGEGPLCTVHVRFRRPGTPVYEEHEWTVPYAGNAVPLEKASPAMRLAASAATFSEWLAGSPFAGEVTPDRLLGYLNGVPQVYGADTRPEKLVWMIRQAKSISGK